MNQIAAVIIMLAAIAADAETQRKPDATRPPLVSDVNSGNQDSPLVQATKRAVRRKAGTAPRTVITDETVAKATAVLTTGSGGAEIPVFVSEDTQTPKTSDPAPAPRRMSRPGRDPYAVRVPSATDSCEPQPSQNIGPNRPPNP
jgi:hypothetical protein